MRESFLPSNDAKFATWLANFNSVAGSNATTLGLSPSDLQSLTTSLSGINTAIGAVTAAQAAAKIAVKSKHTTRAKSNTLVRGFVRRFQANPNVSDALKMQLEIPVHKAPSSKLVPVPPAGLEAVPHANGVNTLKWRANGNASGGVYVVQVSVTNSGVWTEVSTCTKTRFDHTGVTLGQPLTYRVCARRGTTTSAPSNTASVYEKQSANSAVKAAVVEPAAAETGTEATVLLLPTEKAA